MHDGNMKERETLKCTKEEEDALTYSTKKFKESLVETEENQENPFKSNTSYKDKLIGEIPRAFVQVLRFSFCLSDGFGTILVVLSVI